MTSTRRNIWICSFVAILVIAVAACGEYNPTEPALRDAEVSFSRIAKTAVCHLGSDGSYKLLNLDAHAVAGHRSHGDALPGEVVPGMAGYKFDSGCSPISITTNLTGEWRGTYTWDCGGTRTGTTSIHFLLSDPGTGWINGTVSYLNGSSALYDSYRIGQPVLRADGTWLGGDMDPAGMYVRLTWPGDAAGQFVNNQFDGQIAADFNSITGQTLNGDSPTPAGPGCSAFTGASGTFSLTRVN